MGLRLSKQVARAGDGGEGRKVNVQIGVRPCTQQEQCAKEDAMLARDADEVCLHNLAVVGRRVDSVRCRTAVRLRSW